MSCCSLQSINLGKFYGYFENNVSSNPFQFQLPLALFTQGLQIYQINCGYTNSKFQNKIELKSQAQS